MKISLLASEKEREKRDRQKCTCWDTKTKKDCYIRACVQYSTVILVDREKKGERDTHRYSLSKIQLVSQESEIQIVG